MKYTLEEVRQAFDSIRNEFLSQIKSFWSNGQSYDENDYNKALNMVLPALTQFVNGEVTEDMRNSTIFGYSYCDDLRVGPIRIMLFYVLFRNLNQFTNVKYVSKLYDDLIMRLNSCSANKINFELEVLKCFDFHISHALEKKEVNDNGNTKTEDEESYMDEASNRQWFEKLTYSEEKILDKSQEILENGNIQVDDELPGWRTFAINYINTYIEYRKELSKLEDFSYKTSLNDFVRRFNFSVFVDGNTPKEQEIEREFDKYNNQHEMQDRTVSKTIEEDVLVVKADGRRAIVKNNKYIDLWDCSALNTDRFEYVDVLFSLKKLNGYLLNSKFKKEAISLLQTLVEELSFHDAQVMSVEAGFDFEEDDQEVYILILDNHLKDFYKHAQKRTEEITQYAKLCRKNHAKPLSSEDWEQLYMEETEFFTLLCNCDISDYDPTAFYKFHKQNDLELLDDLNISDFLRNIYLNDELFLFDFEDVNYHSTFFDLLTLSSKKEINLIFNYIHRSNIIKCGMDKDNIKLKQYHEFIHRPKHILADKAIDAMVEHIINTTVNFKVCKKDSESWSLSKAMGLGTEDFLVNPKENSGSDDGCDNEDKTHIQPTLFYEDVMVYVNNVSTYLRITQEQWDYIWLNICSKYDNLVYGKRSNLIYKSGKINKKGICHIIGEFNFVFFKEGVTYETLGTSLVYGQLDSKSTTRYIAEALKGVPHETKKIIKDIIEKIIKER